MIATDRVFVRFVNGKVVEWGDKYDFAESIEKSREAQADVLRGLTKKGDEAAAAKPATQ